VQVHVCVNVYISLLLNRKHLVDLCFNCVLLNFHYHRSNSKLSKQKVSGDGSGSDIQQNELSLYLSACKFLDTALSFPPDRMQLFQM